MKIINMRKYDSESNLKAFFNVETNEGMVVKGFKIVSGQNGLFVSNPSEYSKKDDKYYDRVYIPRELKDELEKDAIKEYGIDESNLDDDLPF